MKVKHHDGAVARALIDKLLNIPPSAFRSQPARTRQRMTKSGSASSSDPSLTISAGKKPATTLRSKKRSTTTSQRSSDDLSSSLIPRMPPSSHATTRDCDTSTKHLLEDFKKKTLCCCYHVPFFVSSSQSCSPLPFDSQRPVAGRCTVRGLRLTFRELDSTWTKNRSSRSLLGARSSWRELTTLPRSRRAEVRSPPETQVCDFTRRNLFHMSTFDSYFQLYLGLHRRVLATDTHVPVFQKLAFPVAVEAGRALLGASLRRALFAAFFLCSSVETS